MKAKCNSTFGFTLLEEFKSNIEIWVDVPKNTPSLAEKKIFICIEPNEISRINDYLKANYLEFDMIFTYNEELLNLLPNAFLFEYGTTWINSDFKSIDKEENLSFVCNNKMHCKGHKLRQKIWHNQNKINFHKKFFIGTRNSPEALSIITNSLELNPGNLYLGDCKYPLFNSMFHLCIENVSQKYFFTEKLIDCFMTKTVPLYWGCPNINEYFDAEGIIQFTDFNDLLLKCNLLSADLYNSKHRAIEENYKRANEWVNYPERVVKKLNELDIK